MVFSFALADLIGTLLLMLPFARAGGGSAPWNTALFNATSALCVTGLATVETADYWTTFGHVVLLCLIQVGGFGIMTLATLLALLVSRKMGLRTRLTAASETKSVGIGDVRRVLRGVFLITATIEGSIAAVLTARFAMDRPFGEALWQGVFHSISAFNNAGFSVFRGNLLPYDDDPFVLVPISIAIILGGLGFPVIMELLRGNKPKRWSLHTKMTLLMTAALLVGGFGFILLAEWGNPGTIGTMGIGQKIDLAWFHAVQPRTAGFNAWDYGKVTDETLMMTILLMFVGGGSAGTAGGLKVATFLLLFFVIVAEVRGEPHVNVFDRRIDPRVIRQAITVALLGVAAVVGATMLLTWVTDLPIQDVMFEATSAFGTVGLSTGITGKLNIPGQLIITGMMFLGRLGPITLVSALALRETHRRYTLPEGAPLIG